MKNISWILEHIDKLGNIGRTSEGITRLAFSKEDMAGREYVLSLIKDTGLSYRVDDFGNIFAVYGDRKENSYVATGSHIDTVQNGGKYDGCLGVLSSLGAIREMKENKFMPNHPVELIIFQAEESSRFGHSTLGSKILTGRFENKVQWENSVDNDGISLKDAMKECGYDFNKIDNCVLPKDKYKSFIELHIDQSKVLKNSGMNTGVVDGISAPLRVKIVIHGESGHSGSTAMRDRKDALVIASELVLAVKNISLAYDERHAVATVGKLDIFPGALNVIPGMAVMYVDIRGISSQTVDELFGLIRIETSKTALRYKADSEIELLSREKPANLRESNTSQVIEQTSRQLNIPCTHVISYAGHDAMNMAEITDTGMIFVKNESGISHHINEEILHEDIEQGAVLLYNTLCNLSK